ncbi:hypothetical protein DGG96_03995 [Legionella qingyii]|uniref:Uncharacterized protein n=1 Tax=Legionella qingyii TaxID=2184757 RepID=A0A317U5G2_9GAMM|nr:hypothetical protein [Legionella qingyii]PWY56891.1 hypothetical protein DGG96_03995 [Legionella qingyii]RUR24466.1 hypothetical protein ELY20_05240 [Legionella qingyii]RUR27115.1 hypothetical protein ELY16_06015 [Legionella qingyii]
MQSRHFFTTPKILSKITVEMDDLAFTNDQFTALITDGVCTCIAFMIRGQYWDEELEEKINFCGLYHWSGFGYSNKNKDQLAQETFEDFLEGLRAEFNLFPHIPIDIISLRFIGGEKEEIDGDEITSHGTEAEVNSLTKIVQQYDFKGHFFNLHPDAIEHHHFLTSGNEFITITATPHTCEFYINSGIDEDLTYHPELGSP